MVTAACEAEARARVALMSQAVFVGELVERAVEPLAATIARGVDQTLDRRIGALAEEALEAGRIYVDAVVNDRMDRPNPIHFLVLCGKITALRELRATGADPTP